MRRRRKTRRRVSGWLRLGYVASGFLIGFAIGVGHRLAVMAWASARTAGRALGIVASGFRRNGADAGETGRSPQQNAHDVRSYFPITERPKLSFDEIIGHQRVKREIMLRLVWPVREPERADRFGIRRGGGLLLHGPPGTGKTMIARATACCIDAPFFHVRPADIMAASVGEAESNVERLFAAASRYPRAVIFIDELDSIAPRRRHNGSTISKRVVSQMLSTMEGLTRMSSGLMLIAATNEVDMVDQAMLRPGRLDTKVFCGPPDFGERAAILRLNMRGRPLGPDVDFDVLASRTEGMTGADLRELTNKAADAAFLESVTTRVDCPIGKQHMLAALALMVEGADSAAGLEQNREGDLNGAISPVSSEA